MQCRGYITFRTDLPRALRILNPIAIVTSPLSPLRRRRIKPQAVSQRTEPEATISAGRAAGPDFTRPPLLLPTEPRRIGFLWMTGSARIRLLRMFLEKPSEHVT